MRLLASALVLVWILSACGGGHSSQDNPWIASGPAKEAAAAEAPMRAAPRMAILQMRAAVPRRLPTATEFFDWAERTYPHYFPSHRTNEVLSPYIYRYYPETRNYLGLDGETIAVLGPISGGQVLIVGRLPDFACQVLPAECNTAPVAAAGQAQNVVVGTLVRLDGGASFDLDGDLLNFAWTLTSAPSGSAALLSGAGTTRPTFVPDRAGAYVATLVVRDAFVASTPATVTITVATVNAAPVANAGSAQAVNVGGIVTLDGSRSTDADGDAITFEWTLPIRPTGSNASLTSPNGVRPTFVADRPGVYVAALVVRDASHASLPATATITAQVPNVAPVANAGVPQTVSVGSIVTLNGSGSSDANGDLLAFQWALLSKPAGSVASLVGSSSIAPSFLPDIVGTYVVSLVVSDGRLVSSVASVTITVVPAATVHLLLFGGPSERTYLGCLTCNKFDLESVCNQFGNYGSPFNNSSIWNEFGTYGSQFNSYSPWNQFSFGGPAIYGTDLLFYGYFTVNRFRVDRTAVSFAVLTLDFYSSTGSLSRTRAFLCGN